MPTKTQKTYRRLWLLVSDQDREKLKAYAQQLGQANPIPQKVSLNTAGATLLHQAIKELRTL